MPSTPTPPVPSATPGVHAARSSEQAVVVPPGLAGVAVTDTLLGDVRGREGFYHYRQYSAVDLAHPNAGWRTTWYLLFRGCAARPRRSRTGSRATPRASSQGLPTGSRTALPGDRGEGARPRSHSTGCGPRVSLAGAAAPTPARCGTSTSPPHPHDALRMCRRGADAAHGATHRLAHGQEPIEPRDDLVVHRQLPLHAHGRGSPTPAHGRAIERYQVSTIDHGFNASTFTARVIASTGADIAACVVGRASVRCRVRCTAAPRAGRSTSLDEIGTAGPRTDAFAFARGRERRPDHGIRPRDGRAPMARTPRI